MNDGDHGMDRAELGMGFCYILTHIYAQYMPMGVDDIYKPVLFLCVIWDGI